MLRRGVVLGRRGEALYVVDGVGLEAALVGRLARLSASGVVLGCGSEGLFVVDGVGLEAALVRRLARLLALHRRALGLAKRFRSGGVSLLARSPLVALLEIALVLRWGGIALGSRSEGFFKVDGVGLEATLAA